MRRRASCAVALTFARKVRAAAIELDLDQRIQLEYAEVVPGRPNLTFAQSRNPLRKIPALLTDAGDTIFDSTVICEYLDALVGGGVLIPRDNPRRWRAAGDIIITGSITPPVMIEPDETEIVHAIDPIGEVSVRFSRD